MGQQPRELDPARSPRDFFGWQLRRLRESLGLSQESLGLDVHLSGAAIGSYERGRSLPADEDARRLDALLGSNGLLYASWQLASRGTAEADTHADRPDVSMQLIGRPLSMDPTGHPAELEDQLLTTAHEAAEFGGWLEQLQGGAVIVEALHQRVRRLAQDCLTLPPAAVIGHADPLSREVFRLAREPRKPAATRDLYAVAAQLCTMLGWLAGDLGSLDAAELHARVAWAAAQAADDDETSAWALALQAKNAFWRRDYLHSAQLAQRGQRYAGAGTSMLMLLCAEADAYSQVGGADLTVDALQRAERAADAVTGPDRLGGLFSCSRARVATYSAACNLRLGPDHVQAALREAERAIALIDENTTFATVTQIHISHALAQVELAQLDAAAEAARPVFDLEPQRRLATMVGRLQPMMGLLERPAVRSSATARTLRAEVAEFCDAGARRPQLPAAPREDTAQ